MKAIVTAALFLFSCLSLNGCASHYPYLATGLDFTAGAVGGVGCVELEAQHKLRKGEFVSEITVFAHAWIAVALFYSNPIFGGIYLGVSGLYSAYRIGIHAKNCKYHQ